MLSVIISVMGYVVVGYLVSVFLSVSYGILMNRTDHEK